MLYSESTVTCKVLLTHQSTNCKCTCYGNFLRWVFPLLPNMSGWVFRVEFWILFSSHYSVFWIKSWKMLLQKAENAVRWFNNPGVTKGGITSRHYMCIVFYPYLILDRIRWESTIQYTLTETLTGLIKSFYISLFFYSISFRNKMCTLYAIPAFFLWGLSFFVIVTPFPHET